MNKESKEYGALGLALLAALLLYKLVYLDLVKQFGIKSYALNMVLEFLLFQITIVLLLVAIRRLLIRWTF